MPRKPRFDLTDVPQHVIQRGNNRQPCFCTEPDYRAFIEYLCHACERHGCRVHAYVLMTNHVHLLVTQSRLRGLSGMMQSLGRRYVKYVNDTYGRTGTLWEGRYKASLVSTDDYMLVCSRYIELNPVRAGMIARPGDYIWSSYGHNAEGASDPLVSEHETYMALARNPETRLFRYRELFRSDLDPNVVDEIRRSANADLVFGNERFKDEIKQALKRRTRAGQPGRPKKENSDQPAHTIGEQGKIGL